MKHEYDTQRGSFSWNDPKKNLVKEMEEFKIREKIKTF